MRGLVRPSRWYGYVGVDVDVDVDDRYDASRSETVSGKDWKVLNSMNGTLTSRIGLKFAREAPSVRAFSGRQMNDQQRYVVGPSE
jgi:hypothetical protein